MLLSDPVNATLKKSVATGTIINYNTAAFALLSKEESFSNEGNFFTVAPNPASSKINISLTNYTSAVTV